jgi:threonine synthase
MGIAPDGGLFVPDYIPCLDSKDFTDMEAESYQERASRVMGCFLTDFTAAELASCVNSAYNHGNFDHPLIAPLVPIDEQVYIQELWHGPTCAFKDMALQILPYLMTLSAKKTGEQSEIVILVATSGDTGKAALEGFKDVPGTKIIVFFPNDGVSEVQKRQMITQEGKNVFVAAVQGNFDDAQNGVKQIFADELFIDRLADHQMKMSSANSINWGRLLPQIVYYISAYVDLQAKGRINRGQAINIVVPTGNFGNILAAFYAGQMGVPINRLICASNANNVLTDFIQNGVYDRNRVFARTISPSMDILISSNLERLLYEITGHDSSAVCSWMEQLKSTGKYSVDGGTHKQIKNLFWADYSTDEQTLAAISKTWQDHSYLLDTHTAVAWDVYNRYRTLTGDDSVTVIASTASPFKFGKSVAEAVLPEELYKDGDEFRLLTELSNYTGIAVPDAIKDIDRRPLLHQTVCAQENMAASILKFLGI